MTRYAHPILWRKDDSTHHSAIVCTDVDPKDTDSFWNQVQGSTRNKLKVTHNLEEAIADIHRSNEQRISLGIPNMNYLAFSFDLFGNGKIPTVIKLIEKGRELGYECRGWCNEESGSLVICFATYDTTEESGWDIYEWANVQMKAPTDSYGHASWWEYCYFGIPIYDFWTCEERNNRLVVISPDNKKVAVFGA